MVSVSTSQTVQKAESIPEITAGEAYELLKVQLDRFLTMLNTLDPSDWSKPTACTLWTVRDIVAHQAGGYASGTSYREMFRQYLTLPRRGQLPEDAVNDLQLRERAGRSPEALIEELRTVGPAAIQNWAYGFRFAKWFTIPHAVAGKLSLCYLMWVIHSRDTWMHRLDICRATSRPFSQTPEQDGRIVALLMLDVARALQRKLPGNPIRVSLSGTAGGTWDIGPGEPTATIQMDALDFAIFASGRFPYEEVRSKAHLAGDITLAEQVLQNILILF